MQNTFIGLKKSFVLITPTPKFWRWRNQFYRTESWSCSWQVFSLLIFSYSKITKILVLVLTRIKCWYFHAYVVLSFLWYSNCCRAITINQVEFFCIHLSRRRGKSKKKPRFFGKIFWKENNNKKCNPTKLKGTPSGRRNRFVIARKKLTCKKN